MKTITPFTAKLVTFDTTLPVQEVISRLDIMVNKTGSVANPISRSFATATTKADIERIVNDLTGDHDFMYFLEFSHSRWMSILEGVINPIAITYTIGNPLVAETIMRHDIRSAYNIPPRLLILEKANHSGTQVLYHLPSSVNVLIDNEELRAAALALDEKLDNLVTNITAV